VLSIAVCAPGVAQELVQFDNAETKQRYDYLLENMRCLVCQNQSLADSDAGLAGDLRHEIERMLRQGDSNKQIVEFLVDRYGDFVLYNPPLKVSTMMLWFAPLLLLIVFVLSIVVYFRRRRKAGAGITLSSEQLEHAARLLNDDTDNGK
jgi:cytochrome c-type biogenesis protein CcmH